MGNYENMGNVSRGGVGRKDLKILFILSIYVIL
jgi:hypothetical protein